MALLDFLKRKKEVEKAKPAKKEAPIKAGEKPEKKTEAPVQKKQAVKSQTAKGFAFEAVDQPHISEKSTYLSEESQYVFKVAPKFNKNEIKKAVEGLYGVDVLSVNIIKIPAKKRRIGRTQGFKKGYKKAVVRIKEGQKIEIL